MGLLCIFALTSHMLHCVGGLRTVPGVGPSSMLQSALQACCMKEMM